MEKYFFLTIGYWNLIGSIVLYAMLNQTFADKVMREWTGILIYPYDIGKNGSLWLFWAATSNTFYSIINIFAANWQKTAQITVIYGNLFVYAMFVILTIFGIRNENYSKNNYFTLTLCCFWIIWAVYSLLQIK